MARRLIAVAVVVFAACLSLQARQIILYPGENRALASEATVQDLGGSGSKVLFVEDGASTTDCICTVAREATKLSHAYVVKMPKETQVAVAHDFLVHVANEIGGTSLSLVSTRDSRVASASVASSLRSFVASVYDAGPEVSASMNPAAMALKIVSFALGQVNKPSAVVPTEEPRKYRNAGWHGWTIE